LKNEFEKNLKRKLKTSLFPHPFLPCGPLPPARFSFFLPQPANPPRPLAFFSRARMRRPAHPAHLVSPLAHPAPPLLFSCARSLAGGAQPSGLPLPPAAGWPRPNHGRRPLPAGSAAPPTFKPAQSSAVKPPIHSPALTRPLLLKPPPLNTIKAVLPSRAYLSAPRSSLGLPSPTPELPRLSRRSLAPKPSRRRRPLKLGRRRRSPPSLSPPSLSRPPKHQRVVRKQLRPRFLFYRAVGRAVARRPATVRPLRRHASAAAYPTRASTGLGSPSPQLRVDAFRARFRGRECHFGQLRWVRRRAPPLLAQAPPPWRLWARAAVGSVADGPDSLDPRVKPVDNSQPGHKS
jgi:hypothetical protein